MKDKKLKRLEEQYLRYKYEYYILGNPTITDQAFNKFEKELIELGSDVAGCVDFPNENQIKQWELNLSNIVDKLKRDDVMYKHLIQMLSLDKIQINDESNFPWNDINLFFGRIPIVDTYEGTLKYDGNAIDIIFRKLKLSQILTRGDKDEGLDKTEKLSSLIPNILNSTTLDSNATYQIRGEIVIDRNIWSNKYKSTDTSEISNERNWVAGIISREQLNMQTINDLTFIAYDIMKIDEETKEYEHPSNAMQLLHELGFNNKYNPPVIKFRKEEFEKIYYIFKEERVKCPFLVDGFVVKYPEEHRKKMGSNNKYWKWADAFKFPADDVQTEIIDIVWSLGVNGELCPKAILKPVELLGTIVQQASLANFGNIIKLKAFIGSKVILRKAGEIIPQVIDIVEHSQYEEEYLEYFNNYINNHKQIS